MQSLTLEQCENLIFESYQRRQPLTGDDAQTRDLAPIYAFYQRATISSTPQRLITVTGSKGKGSTAILTASLLQGSGERVGLITSPNLMNHRERIRLNGAMIPEDDFRRIVTDLAPHIRAISNRLKPTQYLSPNGLFIAVGMRYFREQKATSIVLEAGRGGRFDDASLFTPQVAVITRIDHEHTIELGDNLERIAWHKAGIIKPDTTLITGAIVESSLKIIADHHAQISTKPHYQLEKEFTYSLDATSQTLEVTITPPSQKPIRCQLATYAHYQAHNLALALTAVQVLSPQIDLEKASVILPRVRLFGRAQQLLNSPVIFLDGAIHAQASQAFCDSVLPHSPQPRTLITALPADKDFAGVLKTLAPHVQHIILTEPQQGYLKYDERALNLAQTTHPNAEKILNPTEAITLTRQRAEEEGGSIWIIGTQSLVRSALSALSADLTQIIVPDDTLLKKDLFNA